MILIASSGLSKKPRRLREQIFGMGIAAHVAALKREVAALETNRHVWHEVVSRRELPVIVHRNHCVVARMIVGITDQGIEAHASEQFGRI